MLLSIDFCNGISIAAKGKKYENNGTSGKYNVG